MDMIATARRQLERDQANGPKVAALFVLTASAFFALEWLGVQDLGSPWLITALLPLVLVYLGERRGLITWFSGMTLPSLLVVASSVLLVWTLNTRVEIPDAFTYIALGGFVAAWGFLMFRMATSGAASADPTR